MAVACGFYMQKYIDMSWFSIWQNDNHDVRENFGREEASVI